MKTGKAAILTAVDTPFEIREYPITPPQPGMALLKMEASGICGTDIHIYHGKIPMELPKMIGHEFIGRIEQISPEDSAKYGLSIGDSAIVDIACPCGECPLCLEGDDANCINMGVTNGGNPENAPHFFGGYGQYSYAPIKNLIKLPKELDAVMAGVYACAGPTVIHAFELAKRANCQLNKAKIAVVQGLGPVGTFAVLYMAKLGIKHIIALTTGSNKQREELALKLGTHEIINLDEISQEQLLAHIKDISGGLGADLVFEASGSIRAVPAGMEMLRNRGVYLIPGQYSNSGKAEISPQLITFNALHMIGSSQYSLSDVETYLSFLHNNPDMHKTIASLASCYKLEDINKAFEDAMAGRNIKTMLIG
ncbi:MAG: alcohol dehydrogenase catalytic domain-containing protein [Christensenellaceae bacterium]|nr:alcohol dehydrogenase catalytic domain-containing protein [Christensenellaceae bacterium]